MSPPNISTPSSEKPDIPEQLPVLSSKGLVVFPYFGVPMAVSKEIELSAVDAALADGRLIAVVAAKNPEADLTSPEGLYSMGTAAAIVKMLKHPDGSRRLLLQGLSRIRLKEFVQQAPHLVAKVEQVQDTGGGDMETEARAKSLLATFQQVVDLSPVLPEELYIAALQIDQPGVLTDFVVAHLNLGTAESQAVLETLDIKERLIKAQDLLSKEVEVLELGSKIQSEAKGEMEKAQREYLLRQQLRAIQRELGEEDQQAAEVEELRKKVEAAGMSKEAKELADRELGRLSMMPPQAAEYSVSRTFLDWLVSLPWQKSTEDNLDIVRAQRILDEDHYNLDKVKERIIEYLSVAKLKEDMKGSILCFVGPPGTGKTSLGRSIARALGREFLRISLGGIRDEAEVRGHRRTYIGALPGKIIQGIRRCGSNNPVFMLDEIDKVGADFRGDPSSALLEVLDPEQNYSFRDHYLEVAFDLSKVMFITTANILDTIPPALRDRMEVLSLPGYTEEEKLKIAQKYLIPRQLEQNGLTKEQISIQIPAIRRIIQEYTREAGLRNLEREIGSLCRKVARKVAEGFEGKTAIRKTDLEKYLGPPLFIPDVVKRTSDVGVAVGLAWTPTGGDIIFVECNAMRGKKNLTLTGHLGEIMKESAQAGLSYIRAHAAELGLGEDFFENTDIHVHVPEGAIPKDGPSAGITIAVAMVSRLTNIPVCHDVAMTGEITLQGRILPVGGIKEKVLAARRAGLKRIVFPARNKQSLQDIPEELQEDLEFIFAEKMDEVLEAVLEEKPPLPAEEAKPERIREPAVAAAGGES